MQQQRSKVVRAPKRAQYERDKIYPILDNEILCHVGFLHHEKPVVMPTLFGRSDDTLYIHGSSLSRMIKQLELGIDVCVSVANIQGLVLARSAFNHSANYQSVVVFGTGKLINDVTEKLQALKVISEQIIKHRWQEVREPNQIEMKATKVIAVSIDEVSAKIRTGGPIDDKEDYELDIWAGELPIKSYFAEPIADDKLKPEVQFPPSVVAKLNE